MTAARRPDLSLSREVDCPAAELEEEIRLGPNRLWHLAFDSQEQEGTTLPLFSRGEVEVGHYGAVFDFSSVTETTPAGTALRVSWRPTRHRHLIPSGEGELAVRPGSSASTSELSLVARYRPPGGPLGLLADRLAGRRISQLAASSFLERIKAVAEQMAAQRAKGSGDAL